MTGDVLPQERRIDAERDGSAVLDDAFGDADQDAVRAMTGIQFRAGQPAHQHGDDDDGDQQNRLPVEEAALLRGYRFVGGEVRRRLRWRGR
jgi:hypothetical protein